LGAALQWSQAGHWLPIFQRIKDRGLGAFRLYGSAHTLQRARVARLERAGVIVATEKR